MNAGTDDRYILGIETSCDETAASVVLNGRTVLSNVIASQVEYHTKYGGVVPEIASRKHIENIGYVVQEALDTAKQKTGVGIDRIDAVAVTNGPGLIGALLVGLSYAKALSYGIGKPLIGVNHIYAHICANYLGQRAVQPPFMCLVVSGGHTSLLYVHDYLTFEILGGTYDDAAGEAYDKIARAIGLPYPGGPNIDRLSKEGNPHAYVFPRASVGEYDFSFSGVKTSVLDTLNKLRMKDEPIPVVDIAASFQHAVVDVLTEKAIQACKNKGVTTLALAGGVAANSGLRSQMERLCDKNGIDFHVPELVFCTDNAAMVASCGYFKLCAGETDGLNLNAYPTIHPDHLSRYIG